MDINYLDLFSGCGGFALGLKQAGFNFTNHYYSEVDKYAIQIYNKHFPDARGLGSITDVSGDGIGKIDFITFGFPCQDISIAGQRRGLEGRRSGLFYEATRLIRKLQPHTFIFENVKGLFSSAKGADFTAVLQEIADIGLYECEWQLLNTRWFLPQNRERIYFIGHLGTNSGRKVFPIGEGNEVFGESRRQGEVENKFATAITQNLHKGVHSGGETLIQIGTIGKALTETRTEEAKQIRKENMKQGKDWSPRRGKELKEREDGLANNITAAQTKEQLIKVDTGNCQAVEMIQRPHGYNKGGIKPLPSLRGSSMEHNDFLKTESRIRRLSPVECARLQGFPDGWTDGVSDTQKYKMMGNAVTVNVVRAIAERLINPKGGV